MRLPPTLTRRPPAAPPGGRATRAAAHRCLAGGSLVIAALVAAPGGRAAAQLAAGTGAATCDVRAFGAIGDGKRLDTGAINAAIRASAREGGGTVEFPPGVYLTGTIEVLSNITLHLQAGARILGSPNPSDYRSIDRSTEGRSSSLILAQGAENIAILGPGSIDGNGRSFVMQPRQPHPPGFFDPAATRQGKAFFDRNQENRDGPDRMLERPGVLVLLVECRALALRGLSVVDAPNWCIHLAGCRSAVLAGLTVRNSLRIPNADAIDLSSSRDVSVTDCNLEAGDDGIAVSPCADGYSPGVAENITVSNCVITSRSAGVRLGWAARDIRHLRFERLVIRDSNRGIGIFARGRENIEDVTFSDVSIETHLVDGAWWGLGEPVHISVVPYGPDGSLGRVSGVRFENVIASSEAPVVLYSRDPGRIRDVLFSNCRLRIRRGALDGYYGGNLDLRPVSPSALGISRRDLAGLLACGVENLELRNLGLEWLGATSAFFTAGIEAEGCRNLVVEGLRGGGPRAGAPALRVDGRVVQP